jgi:hypothetical protein
MRGMSEDPRRTSPETGTEQRGDSGVSTEKRRVLDPVLAALDPDHARPSDIMCTDGLHLRFGSKEILSDINMAFRPSPH